VVLVVIVALAAPALARPRPPRSPATAHPADSRDSRTDHLPDIAAAFGRKQRWDEAVDLLVEAHAARPTDGDILEDLVVACFHSAKCTPKRAQLLREAKSALPHPGDLYDELSELAEGWMHEAKYDDAVALLDTLRWENDTNDLLEDLIDACMNAPSCASRRLALVRQGLARLAKPAELVDDYAELLFLTLPQKDALAELTAFVARHRDDDRVEQALVAAVVDHEAYDLEIAVLPRWLARHPDDVERRIAYVEALRERHRTLEYERAIDQFLKLAPTNVTALSLRTEARIERGDLSTARKELEALRPLAKTTDERARVAELEKELRDTAEEQKGDFHRETGWLDLADDLEREFDREP
jgi:hypothetical protein